MSHSGWAAGNYISALGGSIPTTYPLTIHARYNPANFSNTAYLVNLHDGTNANALGILTSFSTAKFVTNTVAGGSGALGSSTATLSTGVWYSLCGVFSSATSRTSYVDGASDGASTTNLTPTGINTNYVGRRTAGNFPLGPVAEVAIWNVALSADDVAALVYVSPLLIRPDALVCYLPLLSAGTLDLVAPAATVTGTLTKDNDHPRVILPRQRSLIIPKSAGGGGTVNYTATLDPATLAYTGSNLTAVTGRNAVLDPASFALTGQDLTAVTGRNAVLSPASFLYTGQDLAGVYVDNGAPVAYSADLSPASFSFAGASLDIAASITSTQIGPADDRPSRRNRRDRETLEAYYAALQRKANEDAEREKLEALAEAERALEEAETAKKAEAKRAAVRKVFAALDRAALTEKAKAGAREAEQAALEAIAKRQTQEQREAYLAALDQLNVEIEMIGAQIARLYARRREEEQFLLQRWFAA